MARNRGRGTQFLEILPEDGERRLMLAVLLDAIRTFGVGRPSAPRIQAYRIWLRERAWFQAEDRSSPFSFVNICDALGIDADYVRRCVLRPSAERPVRVRRYAAKAEASWLRQRREYRQPLVTSQAAAG
ncbi:MAG: hypothetical protein HY699_04230 [Deltaproteobacteria bacterium]|nr:hypothetical protein [Deltaproteobacteria bacterium]